MGERVSERGKENEKKRRKKNVDARERDRRERKEGMRVDATIATCVRPAAIWTRLRKIGVSVGSESLSYRKVLIADNGLHD